MIEEYRDDMSDDSELHEEYNSLEDFRLCGNKIKDLLAEGLEIPDSVYVSLFVSKLRFAFVHKNKA
jgi:hypothetical protein